jgi:DedD protein
MTNNQTIDQPNPPSENSKPGELSDVRRKLVWRIGIAGIMVVGLLGGLALFDYLSAPGEAPEAEYPKFTEPVPVAKKALTQPVVPVEPATPAPATETKISEPESTGVPVDKSGRSAALPPAPEVDAVPGTSRSKPARQVVASEGSRAAAQPRSAETLPPHAVEAAPVATEKTAAPAQPPQLLSRLLSGYTLQAGVFVDPKRAEELHARLVQEGISATIETRVLVGPFKNRKEAEAARKKLQALGVESVQLPRNGKK